MLTWEQQCELANNGVLSDFEKLEKDDLINMLSFLRYRYYSEQDAPWNKYDRQKVLAAENRYFLVKNMALEKFGQ